MTPLRHTLRLDPRPPGASAADPCAACVNIPVDELPQRLHELPPREDTIQVLRDDQHAAAALHWLKGGGRSCVQAPPQLVAPRVEQPRLRLWRPTEFLELVIDQIAPGRALDVACGSGRDAVFLADRGWRVTAIDILPDALAIGRDLEHRYTRAAPPIDWRAIDLESAPPPRFDQRFDLICVFRYLHRPLFPALIEWLAPRGSILYETFTTLHRARHRRPARDAHILRPGELATLLSGVELRTYEENWRGGAHTSRAWAMKTGLD